MKKDPLVSVWMITYHHEAYINEAIGSILSQQTNFPFEIVIGEDFGSDGTRKVCEEFSQKFPDKINLLPSDRKYGMIKNMIRTLDTCSGKYIAFCEGDDYWTDPLKLQKQVDFLEENPEYSCCLHRFDVLRYGKITQTLPVAGNIKNILSLDDFLVALDYRMVTLMMRRNTIPVSIPSVAYELPMGDNLLMIWALLKGKGKYLAESMAVYRVEGQGTWSGDNKVKSWNRVLHARTLYPKLIDLNKYSESFVRGNNLIHFYQAESLQEAGEYKLASKNKLGNILSLMKDIPFKGPRRIIMYLTGKYFSGIHRIILQNFKNNG